MINLEFSMMAESGLLQRRVHQRIKTALPIKMAQTSGTTINVSPAGLYVDHGTDLALGSDHYFEILLSQDQGIYLTGVAKVMRKELAHKQNLFGMKILHSKVEVW